MAKDRFNKFVLTPKTQGGSSKVIATVITQILSEDKPFGENMWVLNNYLYIMVMPWWQPASTLIVDVHCANQLFVQLNGCYSQRICLTNLRNLSYRDPGNFLFLLCWRENHCFCFPLDFIPHDKGKLIVSVFHVVSTSFSQNLVSFD